MSSSTKANLLQDHQQNTRLTVSVPSLMPTDQHDFSADEFAAPLDELIIEGAMNALESGQTHYVDVPGIAPLRESVAAYLNRTAGAQFQKANIVITAGMQESRFLTIQMIGERFDSIALPGIVHPGALKAFGVRVKKQVTIAVTGEYRALPSPADVKTALEAGATLLYLESPSRLTGEVYSAEDVAAIAQLVKSHDAALIVDEGLAPWADCTSFSSLADLRDRVAVIGDVYPGMGLASWFIAYIAAPEAWVPPMQSQKQIMAICTSTASQYAALEAGKLFDNTHAGQVEKLSGLRQQFAEKATHMGFKVVEGAAVNIVAIQLPAGASGVKEGAVVAEGTDFGAPGIVRVDISTGVQPDALFVQLT